VKVTGTGLIVSNIGAVLLGLAVAVTLGLGIRWLWPAVALPVFLTVLLCWGLSATSMILRDRGNRDIEPMGWSDAAEQTALISANSRAHFLDYLLDKIVALFSGIVIASFIAGLVGLFLPGIRWTVFIIIVALWAAVGVGVIINDYKKG